MVRDGDAALRAIHDSVKDIGIAGAVVQWKNENVTHQLLVKGARDLGGGQYSFDVFEPWTGQTRTVSGKQLKSHYMTGAGKSVGELKYVQLPEGMKLGPASLVDPKETLARNQIELHQPEKQTELAAIDKVTDPESRSIQAQMLLHSDSVDGMKSVLTGNIPALHNVDAHGLESLIGLYRANPSPEARSALIELMPGLGRMPEGARNHALEQLSGMTPRDLQKMAQRQAASPVAWMNENDDTARMSVVPKPEPWKTPGSDGRTGNPGSDGTKPSNTAVESAPVGEPSSSTQRQMIELLDGRAKP